MTLVSGLLIDSSGNAVPGAVLTLSPPSKSALSRASGVQLPEEITATADGSGLVSFVALPGLLRGEFVDGARRFPVELRVPDAATALLQDCVERAGGELAPASVIAVQAIRDELQAALDALDTGGGVGAVQTLTMVGQTSDPVAPAEGQAWYRSDLGLWRICFGGGRVMDLAPVGYEVALAADVTLTAGDNGKIFTATANRTVTLPTSPQVGFKVGFSCNTLSTVTLVSGAAVERDLFVYPTEGVTLIWTGTFWRRFFWRGFGINNSGAMALLADFRRVTAPGGLWIANASTLNIADRPSHMGTDLVVRRERRDANSLAVTVWSLTQSQGSWRATYTAGAWSAWSNGGTIAALPTASLPINVLPGTEVFDTTKGRMVVWDSVLNAWIDASDRARHTGSQLAATISDFAQAADARVAAGITDIPKPLPIITPPSGTWVHLIEGRVSGGVRAETPNMIRMAPCIFTYPASLTTVGLIVSTAVAGSLAKIAIYAADASGLPTTLLGETGDMDCATTGNKTANFGSAVVIPANTVFWTAVRVSSNQGLITAPGAIRIPGAASFAAVAGVPTSVGRFVTYALGAPPNWGWNNSEYSTNRDPWWVGGLLN